MNIKKITAFMIFLILSISIYSLELTKDNISIFFDKNMPQMMNELKIAGAVAVAVQGNEVVYKKGFGFSNIADKTPVDPDKTLFRAGSISKLFVWTSVMQLYEEGKIELDKDVNIYLKNFQLPDTFKEKITMENLMSHSAGFEDQLMALFPEKKEQVLTLDKVMANYPKRILPPGKEISYSNYGASLAGFIVLTVSGLPFDSYAEGKIFKPLGMNYSSFRQPLPENLSQYMSKGYIAGKTGYIEKGFEYMNVYPAGGIALSGTDMGKFLLMHLNNGKYNDASVLKEDTAKLMHTNHFSRDPRMNGFAHGFIESSIWGERIIGHDGDTGLFHSASFMLPEKKLGVFISTNTNTGMMLTFKMTVEFNKTFIPKKESRHNKLSDSELDKYTGIFLCNRRSESDFTRLMKIFLSVQVNKSKDGGLLIYDPVFREMDKCYETEPLVFERDDGYAKYFFLKNEKGEINSIMRNDFPVFEFTKSPAKDFPMLHLLIVLISIIVFFSAFILRPTGILAIFSRKHQNRGLEIAAGYSGIITSAAYLIFFILVSVNIATMSFMSEKPGIYIFILPYIGMVCNIAALFFAAVSWKAKFWKLPGRIYYSLITVTSFAFLFFLINWKFIF